MAPRTETDGDRASDIAHAQSVRIQLLGVPSLRLSGRPVHVLERRDAALLALLALEGPSLRSRVALLLWPRRGIQ